MENLFSYGTLQLEKVQSEVFQKLLKGETDVLVGYTKEKIKIRVDSIAGMNEEEHVAIHYTGDNEDKIHGTVFPVTQRELEVADEYETGHYKRIKVILQSGKPAWVYIKND